MIFLKYRTFMVARPAIKAVVLECLSVSLNSQRMAIIRHAQAFIARDYALYYYPML